MDLREDNQKPGGRLAWIRTWAPRLALGAFVILFLIHLALIWKLAVNIPSDDEWAVFENPAAISLKWTFSPHNEHRIVTTKFLIWLQYHLNGWNHKTHLVISFIIYGVTLAWLVWFTRKLAPWIPLWIILGFTVFLLSPILWMNHLVGLQVCFHFWLLFFLVSTYFLFGSIQSWPRLVIGCFATILSLYSLATGLTSAAILLLLFCVFKVTRAYTAQSGQERAREIRQLMLGAVLVGGAMAFWFVGYQIPPTHRGLSSPFELSFWRQFLNLVSFGFGIDAISTRLGAICLLIVTAPIIWQVWQQRGKLSTQQWTAYVTVIGILATLASVAAGRAPFGIEWSKTARYAEIGMPLIVLSVLSWSWVVRGKKKIETTVLVGLWSFFMVAFSNNWGLGTYRQIAASRRVGMLCVRAYYEQSGNARCPQLFYAPLSGHLDRAKLLNVSFYREISARIQFERQQAINAAAVSVPSYSGTLDVADCQRIAGWAAKTPRPPTSLIVAIYDGDRLISVAPADAFRADVYQAGAGPLLCGFDFETPPTLKDGQPHSIAVKIAGTSHYLTGTPKSLICAPR